MTPIPINGIKFTIKLFDDDKVNLNHIQKHFKCIDSNEQYFLYFDGNEFYYFHDLETDYVFQIETYKNLEEADKFNSVIKIYETFIKK